MKNQMLRYISDVGVSGLVSGVRNVLTPAQTRKAFRAVGSAIDAYVEAVPQDRIFTGLRRSIGSLPIQGDLPSEVQEEILGQLIAHENDVELVFRMIIKANAVGQVAIIGGAVVANVEAPYDLGAEWRWIPFGVFEMGARADDPYAYAVEKPLRLVMAGGYFMLDHLVANAEFRAFLKATGLKHVRLLGDAFAGDDKPAVEVNQKVAEAYSEWLGEEVSKRTGHAVIGRLPSDAEWEKAAKGPSGNEFITPVTREQAHFKARATRSVNHPEAYANGYGLKDMIGNVGEWTSSQVGSSGNYLIRGGAYSDNRNSAALRVTWDYHFPWDGSSDGIGFRPILVPQESEG